MDGTAPNTVPMTQGGSMNAALRRRLEMAARVRDFLRVHKTEGTEAAAVTRLEQLLERAHHLASQQRAGVVAARGATEHRTKVRKALEKRLLRYLAGVGVVAARENVELAAQFRLPPRATNQGFVTLAQGMLAKALEHKDLLLKQGLSEAVLGDIATAVAEFEQTLETTRTGRREHVGASGDLPAVATEITEQVQLLDGYVRYRFGDDEELMASWASARNVAGPVRPHEETEGGTEAPQEIRPAA